MHHSFPVSLRDMTNNEHSDQEKIRALVGEIPAERHVYSDTFVCDTMALFAPAAGSSGYAVMEKHAHPGPMFTIHYDELALLKINGEKIHSKPDITFFINSRIPHCEIISNIRSRFMSVFFPDHVFKDIVAEYYPALENLPAYAIFKTPGALLDCFKIFIEEYRKNLPGKERLMNGIALQAAHMLLRMLFGFDGRQNRKIDLLTDRSAINKAVNYISENIDKRITIDELAFAANLSPSYFSNLFRKEIGEPPHRYILSARLKNSLRLLNEGKMSLTEIALICGFSSGAHFSVAFRKEFSISPSEYQKRMKIMTQ